MVIFIWLVVFHFIADFPLQGDWLAKAKNHKLQPIPGETIWPLMLFGHALIHAAMVFVVTGSPVLATMELICHALIDYAKSDGKISYNQDQTMHLICKVGYAISMAQGIPI